MNVTPLFSASCTAFPNILATYPSTHAALLLSYPPTPPTHPSFLLPLPPPTQVALRWFCSRSLMRHDGLTKDLIDRIPGKQTDRKSPLGELNWVFTAITDTIAWNVLPRPMFQKLFRSVRGKEIRYNNLLRVDCALTDFVMICQMIARRC